MSDKQKSVGRRGFLKGAALGGVAAAVSAPAPGLAAQAPAAPDGPVPAPANAQGAPPQETQRTVAPRPIPNEERRPVEEGKLYDSCGGDYIVDVLRSLDIEHFAAVPGNTFMGVHEAVINYGMLTQPNLRFITNMHEEASVAMAHGYAKIEGKPMACMMHTTVGLQHASMAIYNAFADRVPIFMMTGVSIDAVKRKNIVHWEHAVQDGPSIVRDMTKWDDTPGSLRAFGESAVRAYKIAMTPPYGPVLLAVDSEMQEEPVPGGWDNRPPIPKLPRTAPPAGEIGAVRDVAKMLVEAEAPVIFADRVARTPKGMELLVELAETLQAPVCDSGNRLNFPWRHPLNQTRRQFQLMPQADMLLALEPTDPAGLVSGRNEDGGVRPTMKPTAKKVTISSVDLMMKSNYQEFGRFPSYVDLAIAADAEATLPLLIEEVKRILPASRSTAFQARGQAYAKGHADQIALSKRTAALGWDDSPISMARLYAELWDQIKNDDWSLVSGAFFQNRWPQQLWKGDKHYQYIGEQGAAGIGYMAPASLGAALANQKHGRLSVAVVGDGDLMFGPGILWTAAHEQIPLLYIVHNNRGYHQEIMQMQAIANRRQRGADRVHIGCEIANPNIDFAMVAKGLGVYAEGPIEKPGDLGPALRRALAVVRKGEPALIDVVSQGR
jgi:thiamine pyrophosphate-dependent acetolactate synthase large subunit-like protein